MKKNKKESKKGANIKMEFNAQQPPKKPSIFKNAFFYIFVIFIFYVIFSAVFPENMGVEEIPISELITLIEDEKVQNVTVEGDELNIILRDGTGMYSKKESSISFEEILSNNEIDRSKIAGGVDVKQPLAWEAILTTALSFGIPIVFVYFIFKQMRGANNDIMAFGKSRAKMFSKDTSKISFEDVAGVDSAKRELKEIVDFLKNPDKYQKLGARLPKGVLLVGPSGVGKTLLAKAIAGEAGVPFFSVAGSEFMEMLVGVGSARARDLFKVAKADQPSLIFIDEIDAIGRQRGMGIGGGHDEREQTLNQILIEMDGFDPRTSVIVLAATNRPDMLDPALVRPGRFDRRVTVPLPDLKEREEIIKIHMRGKPFTEGVDIEKIAKKTVGFSGADIENMLNESAILAAREDREKIIEDDIEEAALKVTMGPERKTLQTEEERKMTAYHEAGHALVAETLKDMDPVQRVSIVARGRSLGHTSLPPERDRYNETQSHLEAMVATALGGRAAEALIFDDLTIGASDDIKKATEIARKMVMEFGMSSLGPIAYESEESNSWIARQMGESPQYSQEVAAQIDKEVKKIIDTAIETATDILKKEKSKLDRVVEGLMEKETLARDEFTSLLNE